MSPGGSSEKSAERSSLAAGSYGFEHGLVAVIGQGHIGLTLALRAAEVGFGVVGYDIDERLVKELGSFVKPAGGKAFEVGADASGAPRFRVAAALDGVDPARLAAVLSSGAYSATADPGDLEGFDIGVLAVPTPLDDSGVPDLDPMRAGARLLGTHLHPGAAVSVESTLYPGATASVVIPALESASGLVAGRDFHVGYSPERIDTAGGEFGFENTPKLVSGMDAASLAALSGFYRRLVETVVEVPGMAEAEMAKVVENTFRHVNVALVNELNLVARSLGVDLGVALEAAATKPFGFMPFRPGPGAGGRCLAGAAGYLSWAAREAGAGALTLVDAATALNESMPARVAARVETGLAERSMTMAGASVLLVGLAYKPGVSETRGSAAVAVANLLAVAGARVAAADPLVGDCPGLHDSVERVELSPDEVAKADAVVLLVDHPGLDLDTLVASARWLLDTRARLRGPRVEYL
jgi:UDP-N-acetyl-D-glucosamine dehydrogenase